MSRFVVYISYMDSYRQVAALSGTGLIALSYSPAHYQASLAPRDATPSMLLGTAAHCLILEGPESLQDAFFCIPEGSRRTAAICDAHAGKQPLTSKQWEAIHTMASILHLPTSSATIEAPLFWHERGVPCKGKPDMVADGVLYDYKTTASIRTWVRSFASNRTALQLAHYQAGLGFPPSVAYCIVQETSPPYEYSIVEVSAATMQAAHTWRETLLDTYRECTETGNWGFSVETYIV